MNDDQKLSISKIEAAQRQLDCAIELWFKDGDEVSVQTLAAAAYQLVHDLKEHKGIARDLLYDSAMIKDEYRREWIRAVKRPMNFFKHADNDPEETLQFTPRTNMGLLMFAAGGLRLLGEPTSFAVNAFVLWLVINKPNWITATYRKLFEDRVGVDNLKEFEAVPKHHFFEIFINASHGRPALIDTGTIPLA